MIIAIIAAVIVIMLLYSPGAALASALAALGLFMQSVLPAALPAMILTGMLQRMGALRAMGRVMEKPVRALLDCPGDAAPVLIISYICGTPTGSKAVAKLYADGVVSKAQATRLAAAATTVSPSFIIAAVGVGMLGSAGAGYIMAAAHIAGGLINGLLFRLYKDAPGARRAAQPQIERPLEAFTGAVSDSAAAIWAVGAIIIMCSAIAGVLEQWAPPQYAAWVRGVMEVTLGANAASGLALPLNARIMITQCVLSFSGLSIHAQALAMLGGAVDAPVFMLSKATHAAISVALCALMLPLVQHDAAPVFNTYGHNPMLARDALLVSAVFVAVCAAAVVGRRAGGRARAREKE